MRNPVAVSEAVRFKNDLQTVKERCALPAIPYCLTCEEYLKTPKAQKNHGKDGTEHLIVSHCMAHGLEVWK